MFFSGRISQYDFSSRGADPVNLNPDTKFIAMSYYAVSCRVVVQTSLGISSQMSWGTSFGTNLHKGIGLNLEETRTNCP